MMAKPTGESGACVKCSECSGSELLTLVPSEHGMVPLCVDCRLRRDLREATPYETSCAVKPLLLSMGI